MAAASIVRATWRPSRSPSATSAPDAESSVSVAPPPPPPPPRLSDVLRAVDAGWPRTRPLTVVAALLTATATATRAVVEGHRGSTADARHLLAIVTHEASGIARLVVAATPRDALIRALIPTPPAPPSSMGYDEDVSSGASLGAVIAHAALASDSAAADAAVAAVAQAIAEALAALPPPITKSTFFVLASAAATAAAGVSASASTAGATPGLTSSRAASPASSPTKGAPAVSEPSSPVRGSAPPDGGGRPTGSSHLASVLAATA